MPYLTAFRNCVRPPVLAILAAAIFSMPAVAQLQPGSAGGTIGKKDGRAISWTNGQWAR